MMPRMSRFPVRVVCHAILRIDVVPARVRALETEIRRRCQDSEAQLVEFCVDFWQAQAPPRGLAALNYLRSGKADALLIVGVPSDKPLPPGDLLTSRALSGFPMGWLSVPKLRELGLLPPAIGPAASPPSAPPPCASAVSPCEVIARWLDAEGYAAPTTTPATSPAATSSNCYAKPATAPTLPDRPQDSPRRPPLSDRRPCVPYWHIAPPHIAPVRPPIPL